MALSNISVRKQNKIDVYKTILANDKIPRLKIAEELELSLPTVAFNLKQLIDEKLAVEDGELFSTGGRKASTVSCIPDARISIGIDLTQNHVGFAAVDLKGNVLAHIRLAQKFSLSAEYDENVYNLLLHFIENLKVPNEKIIGVGLSIPGIINAEGTELKYSHRLGIFSSTRLGLADKIRYPTHFFNDATAASMAELSKSPEIENMVFLSLSNSIGGSLIINRKSVDGNGMHSGEFGHICFIPGGKQCYCGQSGHFDSYCSALVLANLADGSLETFFKKVELHDSICEKVLDEYLEYLAVMICNLHMTFDLNIVLGGYVGSYLTPYLPKIKTRVAELDTFKDNPSYISLCKYKDEASAVGSALYFIDTFIQNI